jgi:pimeloyl-ACP methyl ester carboxylesterase
VLPLLSKEHHVYAPLLPGFGKSTGLECLEDQFDLFLHGFDVIEALGLDRPYVIGESLGGWMAAEMAALRPKDIGRLALVAPVGLWRDEAPVVDLFGRMAHELAPYLFHDIELPCSAADAWAYSTVQQQGRSNSGADRNFNWNVAGVPNRCQIPVPDP